MTGDSLVGPGVQLHRDVALVSTQVRAYTSVGPFTRAISAEIGKYCSVSWNVTIGAGATPMDRATTHDFPILASYGFLSRDAPWRDPGVSVGSDV